MVLPFFQFIFFSVLMKILLLADHAFCFVHLVSHFLQAVLDHCNKVDVICKVLVTQSLHLM